MRATVRIVDASRTLRKHVDFVRATRGRTELEICAASAELCDMRLVHDISIVIVSNSKRQCVPCTTSYFFRMSHAFTARSLGEMTTTPPSKALIAAISASFLPGDALDVEVVGRLVEQQHVLAASSRGRKRDARLLAARRGRGS